MKEQITVNLNSAKKKGQLYHTSGKPALFIFIAWLFLGWSGIAVWQLAEHAAEIKVYKNNLVLSGKANIRVLGAAIRSMGRGRRERPEFLSLVIKEILSVPAIKGAWLKELDGTLLASTGSDELLSLPSTDSGETWLDDGLIVDQNIDISGFITGWRKQDSSVSSETRIVRLFLYLDRAQLDIDIKSDMLFRIGTIIAASIALAGGFLLLRSREKSKRLKTELEFVKKLAQSNKEWALLGAGLAHETKNPISIIRGLAQQLSEEDADSADYQKAASYIVDEVDRIVLRIDEFLQFSRPVEPDLASVSVLELFQEMARLIKPDLSPRNGQIIIECKPESITILSDENMIRQILLNLLVNAACSLTSGGEIQLLASLSDDMKALIEIKDNGKGIPAEEVDKVFEPYYTRTMGGTGLGLAIVQRLVKAHGWQITIKSKTGYGTSVIISGIEQVK